MALRLDDDSRAGLIDQRGRDLFQAIRSVQSDSQAENEFRISVMQLLADAVQVLLAFSLLGVRDAGKDPASADRRCRKHALA